MNTAPTIEFIITCTQQDKKDILVARLFEAGAEGVEEKENEIKAYFSNTVEIEELRQIITGHGLNFKEAKLEEQNWNHSWESNFQPVLVENLVGIRADFHEPVQGVQYELLITPKMSFGTGHHATTHLMIKAMMDLDLKDKTVLDFGTGTGVLAILAEKLGAATVIAIDNDEWSISNAAENLEKNQCRKVRLEKADELLSYQQPFDIILANINRHVILDNLASLKRLLKKEATLLVSGLLKEDREDIREAFKLHRIEFADDWERGDWICIKASC